MIEAAPTRPGLQSGTEITADGKVCVDNTNRHAAQSLRYTNGAEEHNERDAEYEALNDGDASSFPNRTARPLLALVLFVASSTPSLFTLGRFRSA